MRQAGQRADRVHIGCKDQQCRQPVEQRHRDDAPKQLEHADICAVGEEVVRLRAEREAQQEIDKVRTYGKQAKGLEDLRDIPGVGAVKAHRRQTQAADNKERVGHIVAKNSRQEQRKAGEERLREEQRHQRAERRHKEGKSQY